MSWIKVKGAFFVHEKDGTCRSVDIGVCKNCNGIHIPAEDANACEKVVYETYEELKKRYAKERREKR